MAYVSFEGSAGLLTDAFSLPVFARSLLEGLSSTARIAASEGEVVFEGYDKADGERPMPADNSVTWLSAEQSNSSLIVGGSVMLKIFRRVAGGPASRSRNEPIPDQGGFGNTPRLLGEVTRIDGAGQRHSLAVAQAFVPNQGDAWSWMQQRLAEQLDAVPAAKPTARETRTAPAWPPPLAGVSAKCTSCSPAQRTIRHFRRAPRGPRTLRHGSRVLKRR